MSSIYDKSSLVLIPSGTKSGKVFSQKPVNGDGDFTFSRSTAATRVNADGNIEKETQNLFTYSNNLSNPIWQLGVITATGGQSGYDSSSDAWLITKDANAYRAIEHDVNNSGVYTYSVYAKANTLDKITLRNQTLGQGAYFDLTNGTTSGNSGLFSSIDSVGGGWYRCSVTFNGASTRLAIYIDFEVATAGSVYVQDFQVEKGLVARDYIETTTAAVEGGITDNVPRLDYTDSSCPALLLEPQRTNLIKFSEYFEASEWTYYNSTISSNNSTSPDGFENATRWTSTASGTFLTESLFVSDPSNFSVFVKYVDHPYILLYSGASGGYSAAFDIQNNITGTLGTGTSNAKIESYGNGWYRISCTFSGASAGSSARIGFANSLTSTWGDLNLSAAGDVLIYGTQFEAGSYATSYIPTYGTSVTRNQDTCLGAGDANTFNSTEGVLYWEGSFDSTSTIAGAIALIGGGSNRVQLYNSGTSLVALIQVNGSVIWSQSTSGTIDITSNHKYAVKWALNDFALWIDGVEFAVNSSGATFSDSALTELRFSDFGASYLYAKTNQVLTFNTALSDTELADLTTI